MSPHTSYYSLTPFTFCLKIRPQIVQNQFSQPNRQLPELGMTHRRNNLSKSKLLQSDIFA